MAVRYINQIDIPLDGLRDFRDFLRTFPEVSSDLPQALSGFFMQLRIPLEPDTVLVLTQTLVPPRDALVVSVILDFDVFKQDLSLTSEDEVWSLLEVLRDKKNECFEGCITRRARALFGPEVG